jgi:Immunoglobulin-like domain of bacterial spore germination/Sporulation and spore germination
MSALRVGLLLAMVVLAAGCGGGGGSDTESTTTTTTTTTAAGQTEAVKVYFLRDGKVWPVRRTVTATEVVGTGTLAQLLAGPRPRERSDLDATTAIPGSVDHATITITDGVARVKLSGQLARAGICQVVYTLTQFPGIQSVGVQGKTYTRKSCEDVTPLILVESPLPFDQVTSPLHATGTANTFEATFNYEVTDPDGKIVAHNFVTATSGTGTRGTFDFTTKPFAVTSDGVGELIVFEISAENGQRVHLVEIPLQMKKSS